MPRRPLSRAVVEFGRQLRDARLKAGLTQRQVAERLGVTQGYVSHIEQGIRSPSLPNCDALARAIGCKLVVTIVSNEDAAS